jgi:hypothetical protein
MGMTAGQECRLFSSHTLKKSSSEEEITASRRLHQFNVAINKDLTKCEKAMSYSLEKGRLAKWVAAIEARGFSVENHPDSHSVFIKKTAPSGEHIVIDFWEDEVRPPPQCRYSCRSTSVDLARHHVTS